MRELWWTHVIHHVPRVIAQVTQHALVRACAEPASITGNSLSQDRLQPENRNEWWESTTVLVQLLHIQNNISVLSFTLEATLISKLAFEIHKNSTKQTHFRQSQFISFPFRAGISVEPRWGPVFITGCMLSRHRWNSQLLIRIKKGNSASSMHIKKQSVATFAATMCTNDAHAFILQIKWIKTSTSFLMDVVSWYFF